MDWKQKAEIIENQTSLGKRESQVLALDKGGFDIDEVLEMISEVEDDVPTVETLKSIRSKLRKRDIQMRIGTRIMDGGVENALLPHRSDFEPNKSVTTVAYLGSIGSGKTVGAQKHALDLIGDDDGAEVIVIDVLDEWRNFQDVEMISVKDLSQERSGDSILRKVKSTVHEMQEDKNYVIFIEQAHYLLSDDEGMSELYRTLEETNARISLRLISQAYDDFVSPNFDIDVYNIFRMDTNPLPDMGVENLGIVTPRNLSTGTKKPTSEVIQYDVANEEASLWCVYLTDEEREILT